MGSPFGGCCTRSCGAWEAAWTPTTSNRLLVAACMMRGSGHLEPVCHSVAAALSHVGPWGQHGRQGEGGARGGDDAWLRTSADPRRRRPYLSPGGFYVLLLGPPCAIGLVVFSRCGRRGFCEEADCWFEGIAYYSTQ